MKVVIKFIIIIISFTAFSQSVSTHTYAIKNNDSLKLDVYTPYNIKDNSTLPVVIWMHGGGFSKGSRDGKDEQQLMKYLAKNKFIGVSISYRLSRKGTKTGFGCQCSKQDKLFTFAKAVEDFLDATNYIIQNGDSLHINSKKIIAGGSSSGAESVLSAVYMRDYFIEDTTNYDDIKYAGLISFAGAMVDENYITKENAVPTVLFHGTKDNLVPYSKAPHHSCKFDETGYLILNGSGVIFTMLEKLNKSYYLFRVEGGRHEVASIPFSELDNILQFINNTITYKKVIQTKRLEFKQ
ncbi:alpha/beta hydrolase [Psychroserpens burtonensis]|uniref:Alpha/beta hydrolase n=1 Tax=Psychroserpens burtonensis TaxID=49278 RepID=A0A5C7BIL3_9FLAO|nr:alpha/beta hydrolase [Psychroserpens burtonensis]TXE19679.1 alpha/beta hydrolase [Psychroserpens burtonensis]